MSEWEQPPENDTSHRVEASTFLTFYESAKGVLGFLPFQLISLDGGFFHSLEDARIFFLMRRAEIEGSVDNGTVGFVETAAGWCLIAIEINCWNAIDRLLPLGAVRVLSFEQLDDLRGLSGRTRVAETLRQHSLLDNIAFVVLGDEEFAADFSSLEEARVATRIFEQSGRLRSIFALLVEESPEHWVIVSAFSDLGFLALRAALSRVYHYVTWVDTERTHSSGSSP